MRQQENGAQNQLDLATTNGFISSNSTSQLFLGGHQRAWMTGSGINTGANPLPVNRQPTTSSPTVIQSNNSVTSASPTEHPVTQRPATVQSVSTETVPSCNLIGSVDGPTSAQEASARKRSFHTAFVQYGVPSSSSQQLQQHTEQSPINASPIFMMPTAPIPSPQNSAMHLQRLENFYKQSQIAGPLDTLQSSRIALLRDACIRNDNFYLCLHQLFCRASVDPLYSVQIGFGNDQLEGFNILQQILLPNDRLRREALTFFANFPSSDLTQGSPLLGHILVQVKAFLPRLSRDWVVLLNGCVKRDYPAFAAELRLYLSVGSPMLQRVLFDAAHQLVAGTNYAAWSQRALQLFDQDQRDDQQYSIQRGYPLTGPEVQFKASQLGAKYMDLRKTFQVASLTAPSSTASSPLIDNDRASQSAGSAASPHDVSISLDQSFFPVPNTQRVPIQPRSASLNVQQQPLPSQSTQAVMQVGNHTQQSQPRRRGRPPLSNNYQYPRTNASTGAPMVINNSNHVSDVRPRDSARSTSSRRPSSDQPTADGPGVVSAMLQSNMLPVYSFLTQHVVRAGPPEPPKHALHQAYLRSPKYEKFTAEGVADSSLRLYQIPIAFPLEPQFLEEHIPYFTWSFEISGGDLLRTARRTTPAELAAKPSRKVKEGSLLWRMKCVRAPAGATAISQESWVVKETNWPSCVFVSINNVQLEVQRKVHHGKDLTIDLTDHVQKGTNQISMTALRTREDMMTGGQPAKGFAVAVEMIAIVEHGRATDSPRQMLEATALQVITNRLAKSKASNVGDDDIEIVSDNLSVDLADPNTATIFEVPVRGKTCKHPECFDRDVFLETLINKRKARPDTDCNDVPPTSPDDWKCPICKLDARPQSLIIDGFLLRVRKELEARGKLDTKVILVNVDGSWAPKVDGMKIDSVARSARARSAATEASTDCEESRKGSEVGIVSGAAPERWMGGALKRGEVISLVDE